MQKWSKLCHSSVIIIPWPKSLRRRLVKKVDKLIKYQVLYKVLLWYFVLDLYFALSSYYSTLIESADSISNSTFCKTCSFDSILQFYNGYLLHPAQPAGFISKRSFGWVLFKSGENLPFWKIQNLLATKELLFYNQPLFPMQLKNSVLFVLKKGRSLNKSWILVFRQNCQAWVGWC